MKSSDLLFTSKLLLGKGDTKQSNLCRAVSTLYYAMFHELAKTCADCLVGAVSAARSDNAWRQVYRSLDHTKVFERCKRKYFTDTNSEFPIAIKDFSKIFSEMQQKRHSADYDPFYEPKRSEICADLKTIIKTIKEFRKENQKDKTAFCIYVLFDKRS